MVNLSMHGYIRKAQTKYQHSILPFPQHQPYKSTPIQYGAKVQHVVEPDTFFPLTKDKIKHVIDIVGTLLYCGRYVDPTIVTDISSIASRQYKGIESVLNTCRQLLDYVATHPNAAIQYHASDMILALVTYASYLSKHSGKIRAAAYMFLAKKTNQISTMVPT